MKKLLGYIVFALILCFSSASHAMLPDSGWYWNSNESGRGFNIEIQNNVLFMSGFVYDQAGNPIWVVGSCTMTSDRNCSADLYQTAGGQCIGCAYNGFPSTAKYGTAAIFFTSEITALVTINGTTLTLQRQQFAIDLTNVATPLLGEWAFISGTQLLPVYFGDRITFSSAQTLSGALTAAGARTGDSSRIAVGNLTSSGWGILIDSSPAYFTIYVFSFTGLNSIAGDSSVFLKTAIPTSTLPFIANRVKSAAAAAGANAPGVTPRAMPISASHWSTADQAKSEAMQGTEGLAGIQEAARSLQPLLGPMNVSP